MSNRVNITQAFCKSVEFPAKGRKPYCDERLPGFTLEVSASERIAFYRVGRINGDMTRFKLGDFPGMTADDARRACTAVNGQIALGIDPRDARQRKSDAPQVNAAWDVSIMSGLFGWYMQFESKPRKVKWLKEQQLWDREFAPRWGSMKVSDLKRHMIQVAQAEIAESSGPMAANEAMTVIRCVFRCANVNEFFTGNPAATIEMYERTPRERMLSRTEIGSFLAALQQIPEDWQDIYMMAILTGARRSNVLGARWDTLDIVERLWTIPGKVTKKRNTIRLPLSTPMVAILEKRWKSNPPGCPWVFPCTAYNKSRSGHCEEPKYWWKQVLEMAGLKDARLHDLRHCFASLQANEGISSFIIGQSLGHKKGSKATDVYTHLDQKTLRKSIEHAGQLILECLPQNNSENDAKYS